MGILVFLIVGGLAGYLASIIVKGVGLGILGNIIVGWLGAGIANLLFVRNIHLSNPTLAGFVWSVIGAVILLFVVSLITRKYKA